MTFCNILMSFVVISALVSGIAAPEFEAVSYDGRELSLSALRQQGPVMLVFLRGFG
jgi:peroxiredoxin